MALEDFTTYTEVDPNSRITVATNTLTLSGIRRNEDAYVYADKGVAHFNANFIHQFQSLTTGYSTNGVATIWMLANSIDDAANATARLFCYWFKPNITGDTIDLNIRDAAGSIDTSVTLSSITYYLTIERDEAVGTFGTLYLYIYSDSGRTTLVDTLSIALSSNADLRYLYGCASFASGTGGQQYSCTVGNLDIQEAGGGTTFDETGSGGAVLGGSASVTQTFSITGSGSVTFSGSAEATSTAVYSAVGDGTLTFSGSAEATSTAVYSAVGDGGLTLAGSAVVGGNDAFSYTGTSGLEFSGSSPFTVHYQATVDGTLTFSGSAEATTTALYTAVGSGALLLDGSAEAAYFPDYIYSPTGSLVLAGSAVVEGGGAFSYTGDGGLTFAGSSPFTLRYHATGDGNLTFSGSSPLTVSYIAPSDGGLVISGTILEGSRTYALAGAGGLTIGGEAGVDAASGCGLELGGSARIGRAAVGSGQLSFSGAAVLTTAYIRATGGLIFTGEAIATTPTFRVIGNGGLSFTSATLSADVGGKCGTRSVFGGAINPQRSFAGRIYVKPVFAGVTAT